MKFLQQEKSQLRLICLVKKIDSLVLILSLFFFKHISVKTIEENLKLSSEEFRDKFGREKPTTETEMIFHCKGGGRGGRGAELALSLGFSK